MSNMNFWVMMVTSWIVITSAQVYADIHGREDLELGFFVTNMIWIGSWFLANMGLRDTVFVVGVNCLLRYFGGKGPRNKRKVLKNQWSRAKRALVARMPKARQPVGSRA